MRYLDVEAERPGEDSADRAEVLRLISNNIVMDRFRANGYRIRNLSSFHDEFRQMDVAHENLSMDAPISGSAICSRESSGGKWSIHDEFFEVFWATTAIEPIYSVLSTSQAVPTRRSGLGGAHRTQRWYLFQFAHFVPEKKSKQPTFTFAHIMCPHPPYVFDRNGPRNRERTVINERKAGWAPLTHYFEQLRFVNNRVLEIVDAADRVSGPNAIVVVQADHGLSDPGTPLGRYLLQRMPILNAYRVPRHMRDRLYPSISPVNSFRVIFGEQLQTPMDLLADRCRYSSYNCPLGDLGFGWN